MKLEMTEEGFYKIDAYLNPKAGMVSLTPGKDRTKVELNITPNELRALFGSMTGSIITKAKQAAAKENGKKGGRPKKVKSEEVKPISTVSKKTAPKQASLL